MTEAIERLRESMAGVFFGDPGAIDRAICCFLARGHLLIEDVPGVGKTILAMSLAKSLDCHFNRIQLTPDLLPSDVLGVSVYRRESGEFEFRKGPIFTNILLADEINRTSPRTQSALLEAMNEATVSIDGVVHRLEQPFMVVATQNPYEFEGAYALPESQLDRFLMRIRLGYPAAADEARVLQVRPATTRLSEMRPVMSREEVIALQRKVDQVALDPALAEYIIQIAHATRDEDELHIGVSPRGTLALAQAARATAVMNGRDYCVPDDIVNNVLAVCAHRVIGSSYHPNGSGVSGTEVVMRRILEGLTVPT
ncbi:MAG: AAA family ATPase [Planctomycetota bacterium]|nr:AAA family ATPase [Planctomycetota bacterium]